jgi:hypothetical protein
MRKYSPLIPAKAGIQQGSADAAETDWVPAYGAPHRALRDGDPCAGTSG